MTDLVPPPVQYAKIEKSRCMQTACGFLALGSIYSLLSLTLLKQPFLIFLHIKRFCCTDLCPGTATRATVARSAATLHCPAASSCSSRGWSCTTSLDPRSFLAPPSPPPDPTAKFRSKPSLTLTVGDLFLMLAFLICVSILRLLGEGRRFTGTAWTPFWIRLTAFLSSF